MLRNILFLIVLFLATTALQALQKVAFMAKYHAVAEAGVADVVDVVINGLKLDITIAGYLTALPIILMLVATWWPRAVGGRNWPLRIYLYAMATLTAMLFAGNLVLYGYWGFPLDGSVMQYLADPKHAVASASMRDIVTLTLAMTLYLALEVWLYSRLVRLVRPVKVGYGLRALGSIVLIFIAGLDFLAIRGGLSTATANISKVYFSHHTLLNHAAVNPTFSLLSSLSAEGAEGGEYRFFEPSQCEHILATLQGTGTSEPLLRTTRPDVVIILAESFGCSTAEAHVGTQAVAPNFQRLKGEGIYFENIYASSFRTDRGTVATLSGFPAQTKSSIMKSPAKSRNLGAIARTLRNNGYATLFVHGGDLNFTDMASYLYSTGYESLTDIKNIDHNTPTGKWGYADDVTSTLFVEKIARTPSPLLATWLTLSSHEPFEVPEHHFDDAMLNSMWFADKHIGRTVEALRASERWENMLVIIIADHAYPYPYGIGHNTPTRHHIPMLWLGGAITAPRTISTYASQIDLAATLLAQLGLPHDDMPFSRDIMDSSAPHFGYYVFNNGFGIVDDSGATIYDCTAGRATSEAAPHHTEYGKALLQATYDKIGQL